MLRFFILKAWPAIIPLALYLLWLLHRRRHAKKYDLAPPALLDGPWLLTIAAAVTLVVASLLWAGLSQDHNAGTDYQPKRFEGGTLIDENLK